MWLKLLHRSRIPRGFLSKVVRILELYPGVHFLSNFPGRFKMPGRHLCRVMTSPRVPRYNTDWRPIHGCVALHFLYNVFQKINTIHYGTIQRHSIVGIINASRRTKRVEKETQDAETQLRTPQSPSGAASKKLGVRQAAQRLESKKHPLHVGREMRDPNNHRISAKKKQK